MHPIFARRSRLALYFVAWVPLAGLLVALLVATGGLELPAAAALAIPLAFAYAFVCLAAWYPCRATPLRSGQLPRALLTHGLSAVVAASLWLLAVAGWTAVVRHLPLAAVTAGLPGDAAALRRLVPLFFAVSILLYLLAVAASYLLIAVEGTQEAERENLALTVRARDAELATLAARQQQELAEREITLARDLQQRLLPPPEIDGDGFRIAARNLPAHFVAGDFYDVFRLADGSLGLVVGDVAGKGLGASLLMASVKAMLPLLAEGRSPAETLRQLTRRLAGELSSREFVALAHARFDPKSGHLALANAGLPDAYVLRGASAPEALGVPGPRLPLGVRAEVPYEQWEGTLAPGQSLLLLTDGLPEALTEAGEPLGYGPLEALFPPLAPSPAAWLDALLAAVGKAIREGQDDDWTTLVLERSG